MSSEKLDQEKAALRQTLRRQLATFGVDERALASAAACARLVQQAVWQGARNVLAYTARPDELDLEAPQTQALAAGRTVALPRYDRAKEEYGAAVVNDLRRDLVRGKFGLDEPADYCASLCVKCLDFILVPGLAFTPDGRRLGRGKGYYDRLLARVRGTRCGVALDFQVLGELPTGPQDERVDVILTPTRWLICRERVGQE